MKIRLIILLILASCDNSVSNHEKFIQEFLKSGDLIGASKQFGFDISAHILESLPNDGDSVSIYTDGFKNGIELKKILKVPSIDTLKKDTSLIFVYMSKAGGKSAKFWFKGSEFKLLHQIEFE